MVHHRATPSSGRRPSSSTCCGAASRPRARIDEASRDARGADPRRSAASLRPAARRAAAAQAAHEGRGARELRPRGGGRAARRDSSPTGPNEVLPEAPRRPRAAPPTRGGASPTSSCPRPTPCVEACATPPDAPGAAGDGDRGVRGEARATASRTRHDGRCAACSRSRSSQLALGGQPRSSSSASISSRSAPTPATGSTRASAPSRSSPASSSAHFGAFYKRSWRANDWMWGRHDAVQRLVQVLLDPARLRQLGLRLRATRSSMSSGSPSRGWRTRTRLTLRTARPRPWDPQKAVEELGFLDDPTATPPATLPMCAQAIARRLQFRVLREELRHVSDADQLGRERRRRHADGGALLPRRVQGRARPAHRREGGGPLQGVPRSARRRSTTRPPRTCSRARPPGRSR